jgi:serpin B
MSPMNELSRRSLLGLLFALGCDASVRPEPAQPSASESSPPSPTETGMPTEAASASQVPTADAPPPDAVASLAKSSNAFGFELWRRLPDPSKNQVISPASLSMALAMTWGGAKGATASEMQAAMRIEGSQAEVMKTAGQLASSLADPKRDVVFRIANRLFGEKSYRFEQPYLDATRAAYGAPLEALDFAKATEASRVRINAWVEKETEKRIQDLVPPRGIDPETRLVLVNALYFLGDWDEPFDKERTRENVFHLSASAKADVPTMSRGGSMLYAETPELTALELPYRGSSMSMLFVVPREIDGLAKLESGFDASKVDGLVKSMKHESVFASLPKFEVAPPSSLEVGDQLKALGMKLAFDREKADFTGIANPPSPDDRLYIGKVFHKGFVRVDEKGTEAAAATAVAMPRAGSAPPAKTYEFKADRPFLFFLRDRKSGLVLFMGRVADPRAR